MSSDLRYTTERFAALRDVHRDRVRFHNGLASGGMTGYQWADPDVPMREARRETLFELWLACLIDVDSGLFVAAGSQVRLSQTGWRTLQRWGYAPERRAA